MALSSKQQRTVQDESAGESIIDCCAAPGGKRLFIASRLRGQVSPIHDDLRIYAGKNNVKFDKVLLDAPCSGLGVLSKRADLPWNRRLEDLEHLTRLQDELLDAASMFVRPSGVLVYSTCSIDPSENEERVVAFLLRHPAGYYIAEHDRHCSGLQLDTMTIVSTTSSDAKSIYNLPSPMEAAYTTTLTKRKKLKCLQDIRSKGPYTEEYSHIMKDNMQSQTEGFQASTPNKRKKMK